MVLEAAARPILLAHAVAAGALVALTTHHLIWIIRSRGARRRGEPRFALLASGVLSLAFLLGCVLYPTYRVRVRAEYLDRAAPVVAHLFDMKEHMAALALLASLGLLWLSRRANPSAPETRRLYLGLAWFVCVAIWFVALTGLYVVSYRAVGA